MAKRNAGSKVYRARSVKCLFVGYQGRSNIYLVVPIDDRLQQVGKPFASTSVIFRETQFTTATYFRNNSPAINSYSGDSNFAFLYMGKDNIDDSEDPQHHDDQDPNEEDNNEHNVNESHIDLVVSHYFTLDSTDINGDIEDADDASEYTDATTPTQSRERGGDLMALPLPHQLSTPMMTNT
ncbi:hypothetical protein HDU67_003390 [Dinochytrium kinnereticum]|nr:hypothetical protein HDU67_003390 [Dinochytrium kinnereticum]